MAYNYGFPTTYQPVMQSNQYQYQPQQSYAPAPTQQAQGIIWVQGEAAAKAYPVAPGSNVLLMDSEGECFYIKSTDASGMPQPLRTFAYQEVARTEPAMSNASVPMLPDFNPDEFAKKSDLEEIKKQLAELPKHSYEGEKNNGK